MRRAKPATHCVFGMPQTVNSATYQIVDVISRALSLGDADSVHVVIGMPFSYSFVHYCVHYADPTTDEMKSLLIGQAHDLVWTHLVSAPTVEDYLRMVDGNGFLIHTLFQLYNAETTTETGGLFRMISKLMIVQSKSFPKTANLDRLMTLLGRLYQIRDDYANLVSHRVPFPDRHHWKQANLIIV